jgi:hypothetical protein
MLNSGASVHARLPVALDKILRDRGLAAPNGGPLYAYRFTADEITALKQPLTQALALAGSTCLDTPWCSRAFVAIACNWFSSWRGEGAWGYAPLCAELGLQYRQDHWHDVTSGIREGLRGWGRRVRRNERGDDEYLASLICEGGLPLRAIHGGRWLYQWLQGSLDLVARGVDPGQAAAQEAWRVPTTFRTHLTPVAAELVEQMHQIKRDLAASADRAGLDAIAWLDLNRAGWRETLPLDMGDEDARALIERVVRRAERGALGDIGLQRGIVLGADGYWDFTITLSLDGHIEHTRLPHDLGPKLSGKLRARVRPAGDLLEFVSGDLAIMEAYEEDETPWWRVRPLRRVTDQPCPPELRVELAIESDGTPLGNFVLPDAEGLTPEPMAFAPSTDAADRLTLVARGSHTTRSPYLVIGVPPQCAPRFNVVTGSVQALGRTRRFDLELYRAEGELRLDMDGQIFRWQTGDERETLAALEIEGAAEPDVRGYAWKQPLRLSVREGSYRRQVRAGEVRWRSARGGLWRSWPEEALRGDVTFVLIREGFTVSRTTAAIAPSGFSTSAVSGVGRSLAITGLKGATATIDGAVKSDGADDPVFVERSGTAGNHFALDAVWSDGTCWRTELYDRTARSGFTDTSGTELPPGWRGCINALFGVYAACPGQGKLTLEVTSAPSKRYIMRPIRGETPLYALGADIRALLATTGRLDSTVRLQWIGTGARHVEIGLFDVALEAREGEVWPSYADLMRVAASGATRVTLLATPLADPSEEYVLEDRAPDAYRMRRFSLPSTGPGGPWLVYGRVDDRFRIRPRVVFTRPIAHRQRTRLLELILSSDTTMRRQNLTQLLASGDATEQEIEDARRLIVSFQPRTPLQSLDLAVAFTNAPEAAVRLLPSCSEKEVDTVLALEEEMNFLWSVTPVRAWREAFEARKAQLVKLMDALPTEDADRYARNELTGILQAIVAWQPALAFHAFVVTGGRIDNWLTDASSEASDCVARNGHAEDGVTWPSDGALATRLGAELPAWIQNKQPYCWDVLAAPFVAARVAAGLIPWGQALTGELRWARLFDPVYFDRMLPNALLPLASEIASHA